MQTLPAACGPACIDLGKWVARCRDDYWAGLLPNEQTRQLQSIDGWHWGADRPGSWRHAYNALTAYAARHRTTVLIRHPIIEGVDLRTWATTQRITYANGELSPTQIELVEQLPEWEWNTNQSRWWQGLFAAKLYINRHRSLESVRRDTKLGDYPLGQWLHRCREDFRAGDMPPHRAAELEALPGWTWGRHHANWQQGLQILQKYVAQSGHASPAQHAVVDGYPIGMWVLRKRRQYRQKTLPGNWAHTLESLPGWQWEPLEQRWRRGFEALNHYVHIHGRANPKREERINGYPIGNWVGANATHTTEADYRQSTRPNWKPYPAGDGEQSQPGAADPANNTLAAQLLAP